MAEEVKKEEVPKEEPKDPFEGKTLEEMKKIATDLTKSNDDQNKKLNNYAVMLQATIIKLKESGLDLQVIGRNMEDILTGKVSLRQAQSPN